MNATLLPSGLMDVLPPVAAAEFRLIRIFLGCFSSFGYQPVIPPVAEYAETILAGQGEATRHHVLQVADPLSNRMLGLRADMTGQIARIAGSTLSSSPRPLRLCYAGYTLRTQPEALEIRRQHTQVGIERFGDIQIHSIAEVLAVTAHALALAGAKDLTIDLHYSSVLQKLLESLPAKDHKAIRQAVRLKDTAQLHSLGAAIIADLVDASGDAELALTKLREAQCPAIAEALDQLGGLLAALKQQQVNASITIDMLDLSGYGYYCGIGYAVYWNQAGLELGRGGCYQTGSGEKAVGFTLYINDLLERLPAPEQKPVKTIAYGTPTAEAEKLQAEGFVTVYGDS